MGSSKELLMLGYIIDCVIFFTFISSNEYGNFFHPEDTIKQQDNIRTQKKYYIK